MPHKEPLKDLLIKDYDNTPSTDKRMNSSNNRSLNNILRNDSKDSFNWVSRFPLKMFIHYQNCKYNESMRFAFCIKFSLGYYFSKYICFYFAHLLAI